MKKDLTFLFVFVTVQISLITLQIYKQNKIIELSYQKQKNEKSRDNLFQKKNELLQKLYELQNRKSIKRFSEDKLKMKKVGIKQVKKISDEE